MRVVVVWVTAVMPEALSTEGGGVKRSFPGKRPSAPKRMSHNRKRELAESATCSYHPLRGPPPTGTNAALSPSSLSVLLSSTPLLLSVRRRIKSSHTNTHQLTHTVSGTGGGGAPAPINKRFLIGSEHWQAATHQTRTRAFYKYSLNRLASPQREVYGEQRTPAHMHRTYAHTERELDKQVNKLAPGWITRSGYVFSSRLFFCVFRSRLLLDLSASAGKEKLN